MSAAKGIADALPGRDVCSSVIPTSQDVKANLRVLHSLYTHFKALKCRGCQTPLPLPSAKEHIKNWVASARGSTPAQISGLHCKRCNRFTCIGCRGKPLLGKNIATSSGTVINHCCSKGKLFGNFLLLSRFDEVELQLQEQARRKLPTTQSPMNQQYGGPGLMGMRIGMSTNSHGPGGNGTGYADWGLGGSQSGDIDYRVQDDQTDRLMTELLDLLRAFLPSTVPESSFDKQPPAEFFSVLRLSLLIDRVTVLLRNDSIPNMSQRASLYHAVLAFVTSIARQPPLVSILTDSRPEKKSTPGLRALGDEANAGEFVYDNSRGGLLANLVRSARDSFRQAQTFTALSSGPTKSGLGPDDGEEVAVSLAVCKAIMGFKESVRWSAPDALRAIEGKTRDPWTEYWEANKVVMTDDVLRSHRFYPRRNGFDGQPRGRMAAMLKEIASLTTSLPPGIFVQVGESRPDVCKILIVGPPGSPFEGGLFIFDMYLPMSWPQDPPVIYLVSKQESSDDAGPSGVPFHEHIRGDGTVCLSLLNTTGGKPSERWQPRRSTLLSVFVSIQAMILGSPEEHSHTDPIVPRYRLFTVKHAMLRWLSGSHAPSGIWSNVSKMYFKHRGAEVLAIVRQWARSGCLPAGLVSQLESAIKSAGGGGGTGSATGVP
ncbi:hypothetical protein BJ875DRAFT_480527 [Amylocarpus encephaloides]|uniref:UBC core domain-containing protein n=1 Tax=Amylocarpus encephaloides TaxID=45428 RepID=A0A9P7YR87_9HELO|nr:hypothetical protein BJ875DRAFT_480527 [Amylocarpus encephaloides]